MGRRRPQTYQKGRDTKQHAEMTDGNGSAQQRQRELQKQWSTLALLCGRNVEYCPLIRRIRYTRKPSAGVESFTSANLALKRT